MACCLRKKKQIFCVSIGKRRMMKCHRIRSCFPLKSNELLLCLQVKNYLLWQCCLDNEVQKWFIFWKLLVTFQTNCYPMLSLFWILVKWDTIMWANNRYYSFEKMWSSTTDCVSSLLSFMADSGTKCCFFSRYFCIKPSSMIKRGMQAYCEHTHSSSTIYGVASVVKVTRSSTERWEISRYFKVGGVSSSLTSISYCQYIVCKK